MLVQDKMLIDIRKLKIKVLNMEDEISFPIKMERLHLGLFLIQM